MSASEMGNITIEVVQKAEPKKTKRITKPKVFGLRANPLRVPMSTVGSEFSKPSRFWFFAFSNLDYVQHLEANMKRADARFICWARSSFEGHPDAIVGYTELNFIKSDTSVHGVLFPDILQWEMNLMTRSADKTDRIQAIDWVKVGNTDYTQLGQMSSVSGGPRKPATKSSKVKVESVVVDGLDPKLALERVTYKNQTGIEVAPQSEPAVSLVTMGMQELKV